MEITSLTTALELATGCDNPQGAVSCIDSGHNDNDEQNEAEGVVHGPTVLAHVDLAKRVGTLQAVSIRSASY